jgi:hypothetical protein
MGKGGYRYGAGRPGWRGKCESRLALDIRDLARAGYIKPNTWVCGTRQWTWSHSGEKSGEVRIEAMYDRLRLIYTWTPYGHEPQSFDYPVSILRTPCRYGGTRPWFRCPRCYSRRAVLYGTAGDGKFGCRGCMQLGYASEAEDALGRAWRKQRKLAARLRAEDDTDIHPPRPKGMHQRTYRRVLERILACEMWRDEQLYRFMQRHGLLSV